MYYVMRVSAPSLLRESTDSLIYTMVMITHTHTHTHTHTQIYSLTHTHRDTHISPHTHLSTLYTYKYSSNIPYSVRGV